MKDADTHYRSTSNQYLIMSIIQPGLQSAYSGHFYYLQIDIYKKLYMAYYYLMSGVLRINIYLTDTATYINDCPQAKQKLIYKQEHSQLSTDRCLTLKKRSMSQSNYNNRLVVLCENNS